MFYRFLQEYVSLLYPPQLHMSSNKLDKAGQPSVEVVLVVWSAAPLVHKSKCPESVTSDKSAKYCLFTPAELYLNQICWTELWAKYI